MSTTLPVGGGTQDTIEGGRSDARPTIVLVHGAWADGSGWQGVYSRLRRDGYEVRVVQHPTLSLADDVAYTRRVLDDVQGSTVLVGHSYGGAVITEAGNHPGVAGLVYIAGWVPDAGESVFALNSNPEPGAPAAPIVPPRDGFLLLDRARFPEAFAGDVQRDVAEFMADAQVPWGLGAAEGTVTTPAWRTLPTWYLVAQDDRMIAPPLQRKMATRAGAQVVEAPGSHAIFISNPDVVARLITTAAAELQAGVGRV
ncbi:MAG TPA: alpha/beta hydrolase [Longimicrobium sp.]|jgi:pimeloyl-ACP methyl ester carboxylesterase